MIHTLVALLAMVIVFGLIFYMLRTLPLPVPWNMLVQVVAVLIAILLLLDMLLGGRVTGVALLSRAC
jgi:hypothetical protein